MSSIPPPPSLSNHLCECGCGQFTPRLRWKYVGRRIGDPTPYLPGHRPRPVRPLAERFWAKVDQSAGPDACWPWQAGRDKHGYGYIGEGTRKGRVLKAHRVSWEIANERPMDPTMDACHTCDHPRCVNPRHIYAGTAAQNMADMIARGRSRKGMPHMQSATHPRVKLSAAQVLAIRATHTGLYGASAQLARQYGCTLSNIEHIIHRKTWKHI